MNVDDNSHAVFGAISTDADGVVQQWVCLYHYANNYINYPDVGAYSRYDLPTTALVAGNRVGVAVDIDNETIAFAVNGFWGEKLPSTSLPLPGVNISNGAWHVGLSDGSSASDSGKFTLLDESETQYPGPLGFEYWDTCSTY